MGTENSLIAVIQPILGHSIDHDLSNECSHKHIYGKSTANQVSKILCYDGGMQL